MLHGMTSVLKMLTSQPGLLVVTSMVPVEALIRFQALTAIAVRPVPDAVIRLVPGVLGDEQSALGDSFQDGLVAPPEYTRPPEFRGWKVPDVLLSGNHAKIEQWRMEQAIERTKERRPELLKNVKL